MKIALDWIAEYLDRPVAPDQAANALVNAGLPIESITPFEDTHVLDVEVTSNRPDCLSHVGLARELAALLGRSFRMPPTHVDQTGPDVHAAVSLQIDDPKGCPYYSARLIRGVKVGPSPEWLAQRLEALGLRPVNNVVDVTNYVLMELGQPLHAFDFATLEGDSENATPKIIVRRARGGGGKGEKIQAIDGRDYQLTPSMLVIADAKDPVAIAGVMGGKVTEVTEQTTSILLESARFEPLTIRAQARALTLMSDSSYRFERGLDPTLAELASRRAAQLIVHVAGGVVGSGVVTAGSAAPEKIEVDLRVRRVPEVLGVDVPLHNVMTILSSLGFAPAMRAEGQLIRCRVPSHRLDVSREIDLIEEIARVYGYDKITLHDRVIHPVQPEPVDEKARRTLRSALLAAGFNESITVTIADKAEAEPFLPHAAGVVIPLAHSGWKGQVLRPSLLPSLLAVRRTNQYAGTPDVRIFETAETLWQSGDPKTNPPTQKRVLAMLGDSIPELRGAFELALERLNPAAKLSVSPAAFPWYTPGAAGSLAVECDGKNIPLGSLGLISDALQKSYDLRQPVAALEVELDPLLALFQPVRRAKPLPRFPGVRRDLSVVVAEEVRWADVQAALTSAKLPFLEAVDFVTTFRNAQVGAGKKSLTLTLDFRDPATTLRSEQVDEQMKSALQLLAARFSATLRA